MIYIDNFSQIYIYFLIFLFGLIIGSFLNVVILRYNTGTTLGGRSKCFSCAESLPWYYLLPVVSYFALRGKCGFCSSKISAQYAIVEVITGLLFVLTFLFTPSTFLALFYCFIFSIFMVIAVYDYKHMVIPIHFVLIAIILAATCFIYRHLFSLYSFSTLQDLLSTFIITFILFAFYYFSKGKWMGGGDYKLVLALALLTPFPYNISGLVLAVWIGALCSVITMSLQRVLKNSKSKLKMSSEVPFGPYLIIGFIIALLLKIDLFYVELLKDVFW